LTSKRGDRYEPWDPVSNKSVVLLARDGLITMGYSGPAFISGATTDGWIAEVLTGTDLGAHPVVGLTSAYKSAARFRMDFFTHGSAPSPTASTKPSEPER
jgi:hypothetical protein